MCPLKSSITGSEWYKIEAKLRTDSSTAPVVGNGMTLGLTNGSSSFGLDADNGHPSLWAGLYGANVGADSSGRRYTDSRGFGVTTDSEKSGLVANLGEITGVTIAIWKRVS